MSEPNIEQWIMKASEEIEAIDEMPTVMLIAEIITRHAPTVNEQLLAALEAILANFQARARAQAETIKRLTTELDNLKSSIPVIDETIIAPLRAELAALRRELAAAQSADTATKG